MACNIFLECYRMLQENVTPQTRIKSISILFCIHCNIYYI
nr:MAG TPA: hypothetical protein [Caudoviricetes sp.]